MDIRHRWILLIPIYRWAYIGLIGVSYSKEQNLGGVDYSSYDVVVGFITCVTIVTRLYCVAIAGAFLWALIRLLVHYTILKMFVSHPVFWAVMSFVPGVLCVKALQVTR